MGWKASVRHNKKLKKLYKETESKWASPVYFSEKKGRYIRVYQPRSYKPHVKIANRVVRRYEGYIPDGNYFKKLGGNAKWDFY